MRNRQRIRGVSMVWMITLMVGLCGLASLAVDLGRVQLVKSELQAAADAAAHYASTGISGGTYQSYAITAAAQNSADGSPVVLLAGDISVGNWDSNASPKFSTSRTPQNAIQVVARRTKSRNTAVPMLFATLIGFSSCDVTATSIARYTAGSGPAFGFVGLDSFNASGNATVDSYLSSAGSYTSGTARANGDVLTNGNMNLNGNVKIYGDATYGSSYSANGGAGVVSPGTLSQSSSSVSYAAPTLPTSYTSMGNLNGSGNGSLNLTNGNYYFTNFSTSGNFTLNTTGQVSIYVGGNINLSGNVNTTGNLPSNLKIYTTQSSGVNISGNANLYADIYAPNSPINVSGNGQFFGRAIGKSFSISGNAGFHYDESLNTSSGAGTIALVQ